MKTYSTFPLVALSLMAGILLAEGMTLAIFKETLLGVGGVMIGAGIALALGVDRIYRNCRIVEVDDEQVDRKLDGAIIKTAHSS